VFPLRRVIDDAFPDTEKRGEILKEMEKIETGKKKCTR